MSSERGLAEAVDASSTRHVGSVVVSIVVDQLAAWVASERLPKLPKDGGFARLLREGTYVRDMRYAHAATDTAPGHAALYTGAPPRESGVWANEVFDAKSHLPVAIVQDSSTKLVFGDAKAFTGASAQILATETVADRFRAAHPGAVIVSLSLKDRGAIFGGGKKPTATLWYDRSIDRFVTSTAFASTFPAWVGSLAVPTAVRAQPWTMLDPRWVQENAATADAQEGEALLGGKAAVFPHDVAHAENPARAFVASPFGDDALFGLSLAALDAQRDAPGTRLLAVSLSSNDYIGHAYGPDSWEAWDELRRLDASLGSFFAALDARFGSDGWSAILTGDHGITTMPEAARDAPRARSWCVRGDAGLDAGADRWQRPCGVAGRIAASVLSSELSSVAETTMHAKGLVVGALDPYVYLSAEARALAPAERARLVAALVAALRKHPEVDRVIDTSALPATCPSDADESVDALVCRSYVPGRAGDLYVVMRPGSFVDAEVERGKGTSHGSPWLFDRSVPLLVRAPQRAEAGRTVEDPSSFRSFARTLSTLLGVDPPNATAGGAVDFAKGKP
jgi:hypothetical protein